MAEDPALPDIPQATVVPRRRARISVVWIIPILAAVVAIGIAVQRILSEGPTITIVFKIAEGIEAGKTVVKYKDVNIGQVTAVRLSPDCSKVEVTAKIAKTAAGLIVEDAKFWVVEPRVTLSGVSGLGTLLSGNYIGFEVGKSSKKQRAFTGLETPPIITYGQPGRQFVLKAENLGSLGIGSPVYYRRLQAGQVVAYELARDGKGLDIRVFVNAPYDQYVNPATRFWNASGVDVSIGAGGVEVRTESLVALIAGGVAFDTAPDAAKTEPAPADTVFTLFADRAGAMKQPDAVAARYVLYFNESLRGLSVGAPVTLLGLTGGEVTGIGLDIDPATSRIRGRVEVVFFPERLIARLGTKQAAMGKSLTHSEEQRHALFQQLVEQRGLRAQLRSGNLLTGQLFVALDYFPDAPKAKIDWSQPVPVLPVVASTIPDLEAKLSGIIAKLDKLPFEEIGADVTKALASVNVILKDAGTLLNKIDTDVVPDLKTTLEEARRMIATADGLIKTGVNGTLDQVNTTLEELRRPLATADAVLKNADAVLTNGRNSVTGEMTGIGPSHEGFLAPGESMALRGDHWGITKTSLLGDLRFCDRLPSGDSTLWVRLYANARRYYIHQAPWIYHTEGADQVTKRRVSLRQKVNNYLVLGDECEYLEVLRKLSPVRYRRTVLRVWAARFLDPIVPRG
jgi:paraquat-inducible protein B